MAIKILHTLWLRGVHYESEGAKNITFGFVHHFRLQICTTDEIREHNCDVRRPLTPPPPPPNLRHAYVSDLVEEFHARRDVPRVRCIQGYGHNRASGNAAEAQFTLCSRLRN